MSFTRHDPFTAGDDHGNFAWHFPVCGRFLPFVGQEFEVAEHAPYKHNGHQDGSWVNKNGNDQTVFRCTEVRGRFVHATLIRQRYNSFIGSHYRFNTDTIRLTPVNFKCCSVTLCHAHALCTLNPFVQDNCRLREENDLHIAANTSLVFANVEQEKEIARLRSQLGHANSRLASQDSRIRNLEERAQKARRSLEGY